MDKIETAGSNLSESQLRRWLIHEDVYLSRTTREWLKNTDPEISTGMLSDVARDAELESAHPIALLLRGFVLAGFSPSMAILGGSVYDRKAGIRAAILLGRMGDIRALAPLMRLWTDKSSIKSKYHNDIESILTRLLAESEQNELRPHFDSIEDLIRRIWKAHSSSDLSPEQTVLIIAGLDAIGKVTVSGAGNLKEVIKTSPTTKPNRLRVQQSL